MRPDAVRDPGPERRVEYHARRETHEEHDPLVAIPRLPYRQALDHLRHVLDLAVDLGRADAHAAGIQRRVRSSVDDDAVVRRDRGPVAVPPDAGILLEVRLPVARALGVPQVGAVRAGQLGLKTAIVEKDATMGGTCLNVGCIPSKALLDSSEHFAAALHDLKAHGVEVGSVKLNLGQMMARKDKIVKDLTGGVAFQSLCPGIGGVFSAYSQALKNPLRSRPAMLEARRSKSAVVAVRSRCVWTQTRSSRSKAVLPISWRRA